MLNAGDVLAPRRRWGPDAAPEKEIDEQAAKWKRRKNKSKKTAHGHIAS